MILSHESRSLDIPLFCSSLTHLTRWTGVAHIIQGKATTSIGEADCNRLDRRAIVVVASTNEKRIFGRSELGFLTELLFPWAVKIDNYLLSAEKDALRYSKSERCRRLVKRKVKYAGRIAFDVRWVNIVGGAWAEVKTSFTV